VSLALLFTQQGAQPAVLRQKTVPVPRRRPGYIRAGMLPVTVAVVTPVVPKRLAISRPRGVRAPLNRIAAGMLPGSGQMYPQPQHAALRVPSKLARRPAGQIRTGQIPPPLAIAGPVLRQRPAAIVRRQGSRLVGAPAVPPVAVQVLRPQPARGRLRAPASRLIAGILPPVAAALARAAGLLASARRGPARAPAQRLRAGMLPGTGLSGLPPTSLVRSRQAPAVPLRIRSRVISGILPAAGVQPTVIEQAVIRVQPRRPVRAPAQRLRAGVLPAVAVAPVTRGTVLASGRRPLPVAPRSILRRGFVPAVAAVPVVPVALRNRKSAVVPARSILRPGIQPLAPRVVRPAVLRTPALRRRPAGRLIRGFIPPPPPPPPVMSRRAMSRPPKAPRVIPSRMTGPYGIFASPGAPVAYGPPLTAQFSAANPVAALANVTLEAGAAPSPARGAALDSAAPEAGVSQEQDSAVFQRGGPDSA
jgi:hypothetical protein